MIGDISWHLPAAYTGTVLDFEPIPKPRTKRAMNRLTQVFATPSHTDAMAATRHEMKIVPRRAKNRFKGSVSQQPIIAHARYGAPTTSPWMFLDVILSCWIVMISIG